MAKLPDIPEELLGLMANKFRLLGDSTRLAILHCLMAGEELSVGQIVTQTGRETANVSKHLKQLAEAALLTRRKAGSYVMYRLDDPIVEKICHLVCDSLRQEMKAELDRHRRLLGKQGDRKSR